MKKTLLLVAAVLVAVTSWQMWLVVPVHSGDDGGDGGGCGGVCGTFCDNACSSQGGCAEVQITDHTPCEAKIRCEGHEELSGPFTCEQQQ